MKMTTSVVAVLSLSHAALGAGVFGTGADDADLKRALGEIELLRRQNEALAAQNAAISAKVGALEERVVADGDWLTEQRAQEIRAIVSDVLADSATRESLAGDGATAGYDKSKGFFLASPDGNYTLAVKGEMQVRWAYNSRKIGSSAISSIPHGPTRSSGRSTKAPSRTTTDTSTTPSSTRISAAAGRSELGSSSRRSSVRSWWAPFRSSRSSVRS